jgi:hypothetical protein
MFYRMIRQNLSPSIATTRDMIIIKDVRVNIYNMFKMHGIYKII